MYITGSAVGHPLYLVCAKRYHDFHFFPLCWHAVVGYLVGAGGTQTCTPPCLLPSYADAFDRVLLGLP